MFFYLSKILAGLLFPYPLFLLLCVFAAFRLRRGWFRRGFVFALLGITLASTNKVSGWLIQPLEEAYPRRTLAEAPTADAIVVLGGMIDPLTGYTDPPEFLSSVDRILTGESALRAGRAPTLLISGGSGLLLQRGEKEGTLLRRWLLERGWPAEKILAESASRNTAENAIETAKLARERNWRRVILVTSAFHMPRAAGCFRKAGLDFYALPTDYYRSRIPPGPEGWSPAPSALLMSTVALKEYIGLAAYWLADYI